MRKAVSVIVIILVCSVQSATADFTYDVVLDQPSGGGNWPAGTPNGGPDHSGHAGASYWEDYVGEIYSTITPTLGVLVWSKNEWNRAAQEVNWNLTDTASTTHSWQVGAGADADLKPGLLSRVVVDAKISVNVNGQYSGSEMKERQVSISTTIPGCRGKRREERVDAYHAELEQWSADGYWYCSTHGYGVAENLINNTATGDGDEGLTGIFQDLGPYTQSTNPCIDCYEAP